MPDRIALRSSLLLPGLLASGLLASGAAAQSSAPSAKPAPATAPSPSPAGDKATGEVHVVGHAAPAQGPIDRRTYDVSKDLQATSGSISDALRHVPSVDVDPQGNVSLRGDTNVTIMVDGKISALYRGASGAQALQALPANQIEKVEVITNPSAEFSPDGAAGIINLVTRKNRPSGPSGSISATEGTYDRSNGGVTLSFKDSQLSLSGNAFMRRHPFTIDVVDDQTLFSAPGAPSLQSRQDSHSRGRIDGTYLSSSLDYDLDPMTRLSGQLSYSRTLYGTHTASHFEGDTPRGAAVEVFDRIVDFESDTTDRSASTTLRRQFPGQGHELTAYLSYEATTLEIANRIVQTTDLGAAPDLFDNLDSHTTVGLTQFQADYTRPMPGKAKLKLGYSLRSDQNTIDNSGETGATPATAAPDPAQRDLFKLGQVVQAAYVTYEQPFGKLDALFGLRLESTHLAIDDITSRFKGDQDYISLYPTLHLADQLDDKQQLILSYSRRINRPQPQDYDPFLVVQDPLHLRQGNPNLRPQQTQSYEAGYQYRDRGTFYLATLYYRRNDKGLTDVVTELPGGVLLTTRENLTRSEAIGLELSASGKFNKALSYNLSSNTYWTEIDATGLGFAGDRSAYTLSGKASLNWQVDPTDLVQFNVVVFGKQLTPQGFQEPRVLTNIGYRHKISDNLALTATVQDTFDTYRGVAVIDTPLLHDRIRTRANNQSLFVGLTYTFGPSAPKKEGFDFSG